MKIFTDRKDKGEKYGNVWAEREKGKKGKRKNNIKTYNCFFVVVVFACLFLVLFVVSLLLCTCLQFHLVQW